MFKKKRYSQFSFVTFARNLIYAFMFVRHRALFEFQHDYPPNLRPNALNPYFCPHRGHIRCGNCRFTATTRWITPIQSVYATIIVSDRGIVGELSPPTTTKVKIFI